MALDMLRIKSGLVFAGYDGVITSATRSPVLRKNLVLCRMMVKHAEVGAEVEIARWTASR